MQFLSVENASKVYGEKVLFQDISFTISKGDKIALIAKNGSGKTTLLRLLSGEDSVEGETAKIFISKEIRTKFLHQEPALDENDKVIDAVFQVNNSALIAVKEYELAMLHGDETAIQKASLKMDDQQAWNKEAWVKTILAKLKIDQLEERIGSLSGGQKKRVALAQVILEEPDFLILDEPTNHLDIEMIEWLEEFLLQSSITLFMVTHDRYFLEKVCNEIFELDRGTIYVYRGNYVQYLEKKEARMMNDAVTLDKTKKLFKRELDWMRRQPQARTTKAKSRIDDFFDIKSDLANKSATDEEMSINVDVSRLGSKIVELHNISKAFGQKKLFSNFTYKFKKGERVGLVGSNGAGKSTLIKMITGIVPTDTGKIVIGETIVFGYYGQDGLALNEDKTVIDVIRDIADYIPLAKGLKLSAESLLERFLFPRSQQRVYVSQLSGGEKRRLYLLTVLIKNPNFLILDEPTNDLDIITLNVLEEYLASYSGCLIIVSHDRYFMDKLVDHIFIVDDQNIIDYNGNYSEYRLAKKEEVYARKVAANEEVDPNTKVLKNDFEQRKEIKALEKQIEKLETRKLEVTAKFDSATLSVDDIKKFSAELNKINEDLEAKEEKWMEMSELLEK